MDQLQEKRIRESRSYAYDMIIGVLSFLPNKEFLKIHEGKEMKFFLESYKFLGHPLISKGVTQICSYMDKEKEENLKIEELGIDRTKIIRVPQKGRLRPPYESQYCPKLEKGGLLAKLQKTYIINGYVPVDSKETADFLLIELDFMKKLIVNENEEGQKHFMKEHLSSWIPSYTMLAVEEAETDFYIGWMNFLQGYMEVEEKFLREWK